MKKTRINQNQFLILSLVYPFKSGISGKQLTKTIIEREVRNWTDIGDSSVYYILDQLEKSRLLESKIVKLNENKRGAPHRIYSLTQKGLETIQETVKECLLEDESLTLKEFNLVFVASQAIKNLEMIQYLGIFLEKLQKRLDHLNERYQLVRSDKIPIHIWAIFSHSFFLIKAEMDFLKELIEKYRESIN